MIPKIVMSPGNRYGRSFKGLVTYISNDAPDPETGQMSDGRVGFTYVRNLPSENPSVAWKVMAATAMNRDQLKEAAGVAKGGRQDKGEVFHLILNWDRSERETLTKEQMSEAADETIAFLGLSGHQVYGKEHDEPNKQPHLHLAINRVHPETGKIANDWKSQTKLSRWALEYERKRGGVLVPQREANWQAREQGLELPRQPVKNRADYEAEKATAQSPGLKQRLAQHQAEQREFIDRRTGHRRRGDAYRETAWRLHAKRVAAVKDQAEQRKADARKRIEQAFLKQHQRLVEAQREQTDRFDGNEATLLGRIQNRIAYTDRRDAQQEGGRVSFTRFFNAWSDEGYPRAQMEKRQREAMDELHRYRREMHVRREKRLDELRRQRAGRLRIEQGERLRWFEKLQKQSADRLEQQRQQLDRERRLLVKLGAEAEKAREAVRPQDRPTEQARHAFGQTDRGDERRGDTERVEARLVPTPPEATEPEGSGDGSKKKRLRRPRKPRGGRDETPPDAKTNDAPEDHRAPRFQRDGPEEHER